MIGSGVVLAASKELDYFTLLGKIIVFLAFCKSCISIYRRLIIRPRDPITYGKWAIITGSTSGIGYEFANVLARKGLSICLISRSEEKLTQQKSELCSTYPKIDVKYIVFDFSQSGQKLEDFYGLVQVTCEDMNNNEGIGILVNNVGTANEYPKSLEEFNDEEMQSVLNCNITSCLLMTHTVLPFMKARGKGLVVSVSSGSGNHPGPFISIYSSTKAFMTQLTRSLQNEYWNTGIDFYVATPFYIVSNLFKRKHGTFIAPMPDVLINGILRQIGKAQLWQGHGYWFHGVIGNVSHYLWIMAQRNRKMMVDNRRRYDERQAQKAQAASSSSTPSTISKEELSDIN